MMSLLDISELKAVLYSQFGVTLHYHDVCPKPYFTLDKVNSGAEAFISTFLSERNLKAHFAENHLHFTIGR